VESGEEGRELESCRFSPGSRGKVESGEEGRELE